MPTDQYISKTNLSDFVSHVDAVTDRYPQMNEDNTKSKILRNFLELLGWDIAFDVELEYSVNIGRTKNYVDYALSIDGSSPVLFVEAKGYDTSLTDSHRRQLHSYLRQPDVDWGLLSNRRYYEIYRRENVERGVDIQSVAEIELFDLPQRADYVGLLTKEALESGRSQELAERIFDIRRARETLQKEKEHLSKQISEILADAAGNVVSQEAETQAKELVDRLTRELEDQTEEIEVEDEADIEQASFWTKVENQTSITRADNSVEFVEDKTGTENYVNFVRFLFEHDYITKEDLPIGSGRTRYDLNTEKKHKNGDEMTLPKEIINGVYLETHQSTKSKKRKMIGLKEEYVNDD